MDSWRENEVVGRRGEDLAVEQLKAWGYTRFVRGTKTGAYDLLAAKGGKVLAINVKYSPRGRAFTVFSSNIRRLSKESGTVSYLFLTDTSADLFERSETSVSEPQLEWPRELTCPRCKHVWRYRPKDPSAQRYYTSCPRCRYRQVKVY